MKDRISKQRLFAISNAEWITPILKELQPLSKWHRTLSELERDCKIIIRAADILLTKQEISEDTLRLFMIDSIKFNDKFTKTKTIFLIEFPDKRI